MTHPARSTTATPRRRLVLRVALVLAVIVVGAAPAAYLLTHEPTVVADPADAPAVFVTQPGFRPGATPPCLEHQTARPNTAYAGGPDSHSMPQLTFLAYYTATGKRPFCDGAPATDLDKAWAQLYAQLTTNSNNVSAILG